MRTQDPFREISQDFHSDVTQHSDLDAETKRPDVSNSGGHSDDRQVLMYVVVMKSELPGTKMNMISVKQHFVPHLVINHLEMDKCTFPYMGFYTIFSATLFKQIAAETNR
jgi:hypothetical protein